MLGALALVHLGLYLVLTRGDRVELERIGGTWTAAELEGAKDPGPAPESVSSERRVWSKAKERWHDAEEQSERQNRVRTMGIALGFSLAIVGGAVGLLLLRLRRGASARRAER